MRLLLYSETEKLQEKFDGSWVNKKVVKGRYIYLLEIKGYGWYILYIYLLEIKWIGFFDIHELVYARLVKDFFVALVVDNTNFTLKAILKSTKVLIIEKHLSNLLGVHVDSKRLYGDLFDITCLKKSKIMKKLLKENDDEFKSKFLTSFGRIVHWICMHSVLP